MQLLSSLPRLQSKEDGRGCEGQCPVTTGTVLAVHLCTNVLPDAHQLISMIHTA